MRINIQAYSWAHLDLAHRRLLGLGPAICFPKLHRSFARRARVGATAETPGSTQVRPAGPARMVPVAAAQLGGDVQRDVVKRS